jgi:hypothetical protein
LDSTSKAGAKSDPESMPLDEFIAETMKTLEGDADEVPIGDAKKLLAAPGGDTVQAAFSGMSHCRPDGLDRGAAVVPSPSQVVHGGHVG